MSSEHKEGAAMPPLAHMDVWHEDDDPSLNGILAIVLSAMAAAVILGAAIMWLVLA